MNLPSLETVEKVETGETAIFKYRHCLQQSMEPQFRSESNPIFEDKRPFKDDFVPEKIFERDDIVQRYTTYLQDIVDGFGPSNIFIYGDSGLGKTAVTEKMMSALKDETEKRDINLTIIKINCNKTKSTYGVIRQLASDLHPEEEFKQGLHHEDIWRDIYSKMDEIGGDFLLILDEIDQLGEDDTLLYEFPRARSMGEIENARVGVIGISNNYLYRDNLRTRVKSTLCESEIEFNPYNANELRTILQYYADLAFKDDVLADQAIPLCAAVTAQETGDARMGLDLLKTAGEVALSNNDAKITDSHVKLARKELERANVKKVFRHGLTVQQQLVLVATTFLIIKRQETVKVNTIYDTYCQLAEDLDMEPRTKRRVRDFVKILAEKGLLEAEENNLGGAGGRWYSYTTVISPRTIIEAVEDSGDRFTNLVTSDILAELERYEHDVGSETGPKQARLPTK